MFSLSNSIAFSYFRQISNWSFAQYRSCDLSVGLLSDASLGVSHLSYEMKFISPARLTL